MSAALAVAGIVVPVLLVLIAGVWRAAINSGRQEEHFRDIDRRLDRLERHAGMWDRNFYDEIHDDH